MAASAKEPMKRKRAGRPGQVGGSASSFDQAVFDRICSLIADGKSVREACKAPGMPNRATFMRWARSNPELQAQYDRAYIDYEHSVLDDIHFIADTEKDVRRATVMIDARKWDLKIRNRKRFGDQMRNEHSGEGGGPITFTLTQHDADV
jgi:hypothetical protein